MKIKPFSTIKTLREQLEKKEITHQEIKDFFLARIKNYDPQLHSVIELFDTHTEESAGILAGIPGIIKDNICQKDQITSCASRILSNYRAPYDATVVSQIKENGGYSLGRANCDEFSMGSSTETSAFGPTSNPWNTQHVPGGSSGGSAAAVAAGLVPWALGSETGGSVRQPAAFCGVVGMKPTYGRVSRYGLVAYASSLDQIGPLTRTVYDNALLLSVIAGPDKHDATTATTPVEKYVENLSPKLMKGLKIGIVDNAYYAEGISDEVKSALEEALEEYKRLGAELVHLNIPLMDYSAASYFMVSRAEAASNLARYDGVRYGVRDKEAQSLMEMYSQTRSQGFGHIVKQRILVGNYVLSAGHADQYYLQAKRVQALLREQILEAFNKVHVLFAPVTPTTAFPKGTFDNNMFLLDLQDYFTCAANLAGIPAISLPCGMGEKNLPIGFQLMGPDFSESLLYSTAYAYEQATPWHTMYPQQFS